MVAIVSEHPRSVHIVLSPRVKSPEHYVTRLGQDKSFQTFGAMK